MLSINILTLQWTLSTKIMLKNFSKRSGTARYISGRWHVGLAAKGNPHLAVNVEIQLQRVGVTLKKNTSYFAFSEPESPEILTISN